MNSRIKVRVPLCGASRTDLIGRYVYIKYMT